MYYYNVYSNNWYVIQYINFNFKTDKLAKFLFYNICSNFFFNFCKPLKNVLKKISKIGYLTLTNYFYKVKKNI